jgi:hypothetical protein
MIIVETTRATKREQTRFKNLGIEAALASVVIALWHQGWSYKEAKDLTDNAKNLIITELNGGRDLEDIILSSKNYSERERKQMRNEVVDRPVMVGLGRCPSCGGQMETIVPGIVRCNYTRCNMYKVSRPAELI